MSKVYTDLILDVSKLNNSIKLEAKQNDVNSRFLRITLVNSKSVIDVSAFTSAQINIKRADGETEAFAGEISEGKVIVPLPAWALEIAGYASCDISILNADGAILSSLSFRLFVEKSNYKREISEDDPNYTAFEKALIDIESLKSGGSGGGGGFKKIGFTDDCDYVATAEDGYSAFASAVADASDGDTILVMPGTYNGTTELSIAKNLSFVGVGMPVIKFPIYIYGEGEEEFNGESCTIITPIVSYTTNWDGFVFNGPVKVYHNQAYSGQNIHSTINMTNCVVEVDAGNKYGACILMGKYRRSVFKLSASNLGSFTVGGLFYDADSLFEDCKLYLNCPVYQTLTAVGCDIYLLYKVGSGVQTYDYYDFEGCSIYNPNGVTLGDSENYYSPKSAKNCLVFGANPFGRAEILEGCMLFSGTAL